MSTQAFTEDDYWRIVLNNHTKDGKLPYGDAQRLIAMNEHVNAYITATCSQVISDDEQYQEIAYPKTDNEGEVLWSKNAIRESRKQRMQRVVDRNDLRAEQRRTLARLTGGTKICTCDCHTRQGAEQDNHCSLC